MGVLRLYFGLDTGLVKELLIVLLSLPLQLFVHGCLLPPFLVD